MYLVSYGLLKTSRIQDFKIRQKWKSSTKFINTVSREIKVPTFSGGNEFE